MDLDSAPTHLKTIADAASRIGSAFHPFLTHISSSPSTYAELTHLISLFFATSSALQRLSSTVTNLHSASHIRRWNEYAPELVVAAFSIDFTCKDIKRVLGEGLMEGEDQGLGSKARYGGAWRKCEEYFEEESGNRLRKRVEYYVSFLGEMVEALARGEPRDHDAYEELALRIERLYWVQKPRFKGIAAPEVTSPPSSPGLSKPPSFERRRPRANTSASRSPHHRRRSSSCSSSDDHSSSNHHHRHRRPAAPSPPPAARRYSQQSASGRYRTNPPDAWPHYHPSSRRPGHDYRGSFTSGMEPGWRPPPTQPDGGHYYAFSDDGSVFSSSENSSRGGSSGSASAGGSRHHHRHHKTQKKHWVQQVFERKPSSTPLVLSGGRSGCFAAHRPNTIEKMEDEGFERIQVLSFEESTLRVSLWQESIHHRAKLCCETRAPNKPRKIAAKFLTDLVVERDGCWLKFAIVRKGDTFAGLRFGSMEQLVIFHSIFLALRSQDTFDPVTKVKDHKLKGENEVFEAVIYDDRYEHFLKLLHDTVSGCIRLQASILDGSMARVPVWTSFITHQIHSPHWLHYIDSKTVHLADLHRYVLMREEEYTPQVGAVGSGGPKWGGGSAGGEGEGMGEIVFTSGKVTEQFITRIDRLGEMMRADAESSESSSEEEEEEEVKKKKSKNKEKAKGKKGKK